MKRSDDAAFFVMLSILALPACLLLVTLVAFLALGGFSADASFGARAILGSIAMLFTLPALVLRGRAPLGVPAHPTALAQNRP